MRSQGILLSKTTRTKAKKLQLFQKPAEADGKISEFLMNQRVKYKAL
jgi:hypothetical protein